VTPLVGEALFLEYEDVLGRVQLMEKSPLSLAERERFLDAFLGVCEWVDIYFGWRPNLRDENDNHLVELAVAGDLANRGQILKSMGEFELARASLEEAIAIPAQAAEPATLTYNLHVLANIYREQGDLDSALSHLKRADEISRRHLRPIVRAFHVLAIAHIHLQRGEIEQSLRAYEESVETSRRSRHADGLVQSLRAQGEVLLGLSRYTEALPPLQRSGLGSAARSGAATPPAAPTRGWRCPPAGVGSTVGPGGSPGSSGAPGARCRRAWRRPGTSASSQGSRARATGAMRDRDR
jgi:tetratricopeptide (TPR) repeat protein